MGLFDNTPDPSAYGAALSQPSQPGYGYGSPLLLPQVAAAYQNDPKTALVRSLLQSNQEGLKSFMPSGKAVAGHVIASGLGALAAALQGQRYQEANQGALDTMKEAYAAAQPTPAQTDAQGNVTSPAVPADMRRVGQILMGNAATAGPALANLQTIMAKYQEPTKLGRGDIITTPGTGQVLAANTMPSTSFGQLVQERSALANANPNDPRIALYDAQIAKGNQEGGIGFGPTGAAAIPGFGQAKANVEAPAAGAVETAKNPALIERAGGVTTAEIGAKTTPAAIKGQANLAGATAGSEARARAPYETVDVPPGGIVMPKSAIVGGAPSAPRAAVSATAPLAPQGSTPAPGSPAYSASSTVRPDIPPSPPPQNGVPQPGSAATSAAGGSRPGTPPPADPSVISPAQAPGGTSPFNLQKLPGGGFANTASPLTINNTSITGGNKLAETSAELDAKEVDAARQDAQASVKGAQSAQMIKDFMPNVKMGWNGERLTQAGEILKTLGVSDKSITDLLHTNVADAQVLNTKFLDLAVSGIKGTGVQRPGSVLPTFLGRYPNLGTEPDAASMLANATIMDSKYKTDYADGKDARRQESMVGAQQPGSAYKGLTGFDKDFRTSNPPLYYVHAAEAMSGKDVAWKQVTSDAERARVVGLMPPGTHFLLPQPIQGPNGESISWGIKQ